MGKLSDTDMYAGDDSLTFFCFGLTKGKDTMVLGYTDRVKSLVTYFMICSGKHDGFISVFYIWIEKVCHGSH